MPRNAPALAIGSSTEQLFAIELTTDVHATTDCESTISNFVAITRVHRHDRASYGASAESCAVNAQMSDETRKQGS
jgi:hypothetical protein